MDDNAACESAIGDVFNRKEVRVLLVFLSFSFCTSLHKLPGFLDVGWMLMACV